MKDSIINLVLVRMAEGYEEQLPLYEKMYHLAKAQAQCLGMEEVDTDRLTELINERQDLIETLERGNLKINKLKEEVCSALELDSFSISGLKMHLGGTGVERLEIVLADLARILEEIKKLDGSNEDNLRKKIKGIMDRLSHVHNAKKAHNAYQSPGSTPDGVFIDYSK